MNKKAKITLNLSAIALALAIGAQFYTNYKIDRTLQQFPYHFKEHFTIQVDEKNSDFFTRDLTFSIIHKDNAEPTEFIQTKLIALPFAITAQSHIPTTLVKKINKALNITIDKNTISSQFSVVGDYLQSDILTEFRDGTNTPQMIETELTYSSKNGVIHAKSDLSGLNYDANSKIKGVSGRFLLQPVSESHYDMTEADIHIDNAHILLLDGEDSRFELANATYSLNKNITLHGYDLTTKLNNQLLKFSDKNTKKDEHKLALEGLEISSKQLSVPNHITFYDQLRDIDIENLNLKQLIGHITGTLFNNDLFEMNISAKKFSVPHQIEVKNTVANMALHNMKKEDARQSINFTSDEINIHQNNTEKFIQPTLSDATKTANTLKIKGIKWNYESQHINLSEHLNLLHKYMPKKIDDITYYQNNNPEFLDDLKKLAEQYHTELKTQFSINNISNPGYFSIENILLNYEEAPQENNFTLAIKSSFDKFILEKENIQFGAFHFNLPITLNPNKTVYPLYICSGNTFSMLCMNNMSYQTYQQLQHDVFSNTTGGIENADFSVDIDTVPSTTKQSVNGKLIINLLPQTKKGNLFVSPLFQGIESADITANLTFPTALIDDIGNSESEKGKLKTGLFWNWLQQSFNSDQPLMKLANINNDQYEFQFEQKNGKYFINGTDIIEFEKSLEEEKKRHNEETEGAGSSISEEEQKTQNHNNVPTEPEQKDTPPIMSEKADEKTQK